MAISVVEARWSVPDRWQEAVAERSCMTRLEYIQGTHGCAAE